MARENAKGRCLVSAGATIPAGYRLADGWVLLASQMEWLCTYDGSCPSEAVYGVDQEPDERNGFGACAAHAVRAGALVPVGAEVVSEGPPLRSLGEILRAPPRLSLSVNKPEVCACAESLVLREELASGAAHLATLLDLTGNTVEAREAARRWLDGLEARLP